MIRDSLDLLIDIWQFLKARKKYWLIPLVISLLVVGLVIILAHGSALAPFIYTIF
jgi:hypothetical protein